jgi:hypothetical protein
MDSSRTEKSGKKRDRVEMTGVIETAKSGQSFTLKMKATPYTDGIAPASTLTERFFCYQCASPSA